MSKRTDKIEEMFKLVSELESGDYDGESFARLHSMSVSKLDYWRHRFHRRNQTASGSVELKPVSQESSIIIIYPNGVTIRLNCHPPSGAFTGVGDFAVIGYVFAYLLAPLSALPRGLRYAPWRIFADHLPLYRQLQRFTGEGIDIASAIMDHWAKLGMQRLSLLYDHQKELVLKSKYLQADETTIKVLDHQNKKGKSHQGYFWVYYDPLGKQTLFKYETGRGGKYPFDILKDFTGYLQTDGYAGYEGLAEREGFTHLACWAHTRRKFTDSKSYDQQKASIALALIQDLYTIGRQARENKLDADQIKELRLQQALPKYNLLGRSISANISKVLPKRPIGVAMRYALERWEELGAYIYDGKLQIDNNLTENTIRPSTIGRKNFRSAGPVVRRQP